MYCKTITYIDYNGNKTTEDFYFNLSKAELLEMEMERPGGMVEYLNTIVEAENTREVIGIFKDIVRRSIGKKSADGKRFIKNEEIRSDFMASEAYSELFMELMTNAEEAANFVNRIMPQDLAVQAAAAQARQTTAQPPQAAPETVPFQPPMTAPMPPVMSNPQPNA